MSAFRESRGVPLPSLWQLLILVVGSCAGWLVWTQLVGPPATPESAPPSANTSLDKFQTIERIANGGPDAVPELIELLSDSDAATRRYALFGLGRIGPAAAEALEQIRERLTDDDAHVRMYATTAFWQVGRNPEEAASVAARLLADPDSRVREDAASFLETLGPRAIDAVSQTLRSELAAARIVALQLLRLWEWDNEKPDVSQAVRALEDDPDPAVQLEALATIGVSGRPTASEIRLLMHKEPAATFKNGPLVVGYQRGNSNSMTIALAAIVREGPDAADLLPDVLELLDNSDESGNALWQILPVLNALKSEARPAIPRLRELFRKFQHGLRGGGPSDICIVIAQTMFHVGADADELTSILTQAVKSSDLWICRDAGKLLCRVSPVAARQEALRVIAQLAKTDASIDIRDLYALEGLAQFAGEAVALLIPLIGRGNVGIECAIRTLGEMGQTAAPAVPALVARLNSNTGLEMAGRERMIIAETLGKIGPAGQSAIPALVSMLVEPNGERQQTGPRTRDFRMDPTGGPEYRNSAIQALPALSADSREVLDKLVQQLHAREPSVRAHAALAIGRMSCDRNSAIPDLTAGLSDESPFVRSAAAVTLGKLGSEAKSAVPALQRMLHEPGNWVRNSRYSPVGVRKTWGSVYVPELDDLSIREATRSALSQIEE